MQKALFKTLLEVVAQYPPHLRAAQERDVPRQAYHARLLFDYLERVGKTPGNCTVMDIGGGVGMFTLLCRALGWGRVVLIDDFRDPVNEELGDGILDIHRQAGVEVITRDVIKDGLPSELGSDVDVITCFATIEHWHHSPKRVLHQAWEKLKPRGVLIISVPNCVNVRKRLTVPFGYGKWSQMKDWYETERFRGHVREPDVEDLWYIARDLGMKQVLVKGRNWAGYVSGSALIRWCTGMADALLQLRPSLCSDLYLIGEKEVSGGNR
ncbi:MAG: class I SAM-dependent methyltransferase [Nitrospira sp.]|nr:class I SAM-dependent methyltransferase [Nitrospira sp.]